MMPTVPRSGEGRGARRVCEGKPGPPPSAFVRKGSGELQDLHYQARVYLQVGAMAFVLSALGMPIAMYLLRRFNVMDRVQPNKIHNRPIPRGGGIVIFLAFAIAVIIPWYRDNPMKGVLIGSAICMAVGAIDDFRGGISAVVKFITLIGTTLILSFYGVRLDVFGWEPANLLITMVWIVGVTSAFNGIDNMDGLAAGVAAIVATMYMLIALQAYLAVGSETNLTWFGLLAAGLIGANLGFLIYNFKPARIFMGDSGSFFLGFTLSALGVMGEWTSNPVIACSIPILILGVPIFDFAYILVARIVSGETRTVRSVISHCAPDHLSHRLVWMGFSQRKAVLLIYLVSTALGISAILLRNSQSYLDNALALFQGLAIVSIVMFLMLTAARRQRHLSLQAAEFHDRQAAAPADEDRTSESAREVA
jgi:UDP-GlcNAc:undecaprenyl-phosphate/decaprenyl-phosphate GlcNAc-1-phosphate transferase